MSHIYKASEWEDGIGNWYVNDTSDLAGVSGYWWVPSRILGITPAEYVKWLVETYAPDRIKFDGKTLIFSWDKGNYSKAHSYLLYINKVARNKKFIC